MSSVRIFIVILLMQIMEVLGRIQILIVTVNGDKTPARSLPPAINIALALAVQDRPVSGSVIDVSTFCGERDWWNRRQIY